MDFFSFAKNMGKNIGKHVSKVFSGIYSKKILDHFKQSATDALKISSKKDIKKKTAGGSGDLIGNKIADRINC